MQVGRISLCKLEEKEANVNTRMEKMELVSFKKVEDDGNIYEFKYSGKLNSGEECDIAIHRVKMDMPELTFDQHRSAKLELEVLANDEESYCDIICPLDTTKALERMREGIAFKSVASGRTIKYGECWAKDCNIIINDKSVNINNYIEWLRTKDFYDVSNDLLYIWGYGLKTKTELTSEELFGKWTWVG